MIKKNKLHIFLLLLLLSICLVGCGNDGWKSKVELSNLKIEDNYVVGKMKNKTDNYYKVRIDYIISSGSLSNESSCNDELKPNETKDIKCLEMNYDSTYNIEIKDVILTESTIPKKTNYSGTDVEITEEELDYYYKDISSDFNMQMIGIFTYENNDRDSMKYPYITSIKLSGEDKIQLYYMGTYNGIKVNVAGEYKIKSKELGSLMIFVSNSNNDTIDTLRFNISHINFFMDNALSSELAYVWNNLKTTNEEGYAYKIGNLMYSVSESDGRTIFHIYEKNYFSN